MKKLLLEVNDLKKHFPVQSGLFRRVVGAIRAVDGVSLEIYEGEMLGLLGESGCGKSTLGRCILNLLEPTSGEINLYLDNDKPIQIHDLERQEIKQFRKNVQMIFQDPYASLNPRMTVKDIVSEPLLMLAKPASNAELNDRVREILEQVGLNVEHMSRYPHSFSGGQRQRVGLARALIINPKLIVADEPVSALDVSIQAQILNLLKKMQENYNLTYIFISHDISVVRYITNRVAVMYRGKIVETAATHDLLAQPQHPYTEALLASVPRGIPGYAAKHTVLPEEPIDQTSEVTGCVFHTRCPYKKDICTQVEPKLRKLQDGHYAACHISEELELVGNKVNSRK